MNKEHVKSILRLLDDRTKLNILVIGATHERYESTLCLTGHNFYSLIIGKEWDKSYAEIPKNYLIIDHIPRHIQFDLVLTHVSGERLDIANDIGYKLNIPVIRHTHTLPESEQEKNIYHLQRADASSFISQYSQGAWGHLQSYVINHGLDTDFWCGGEKVKRSTEVLSVVNLWAQRDWACGWNLWNKSITGLQVKVLGKNPGLSEPAKNIFELRKSYYNAGVFLNTSKFSPVPMSLLEAMACGCPVVSTATCMIPEIIQNGYNGVLANDPEEINSACHKLLKDIDYATYLGDNAQKTILEHYNIEKFTKNWNELFYKVIKK